MKTLSPQELIDLPGYGNAEKHLRRSGMWVKTDAEKLSHVYSRIGDAMHILENVE